MVNIDIDEAVVVDNFDINKNGIQLIIEPETIEIYTDIFRTIPVYVKETKSGVYISSDFRKVLNFHSYNLEYDIIGFWEIVLYGSALNTRTFYKNVKQLPCASKLVLNKKDKCILKIENYWNFDVRVDQSINSLKKAAEGLYEILDFRFSKLDAKNKYVMGMSGGLDSRLTLAFLSKHISPRNLSLFTYGFNKNIDEYNLAKKVSKQFGFNEPMFHKLSTSSYREALEYLPENSGGQISINHSHIIDYLRKNNCKDHIQISNYLSDAIFGYECYESEKNNYKDLDAYLDKNLYNIKLISNKVKKKIAKDYREIFINYNSNSNFCSLSEYKYFVERHPKFHLLLASIQKEYVKNNILIYADYQLIKYVLSVPKKYRQQKNLIEYILNNYFEKKMANIGNISSLDFRPQSNEVRWKKKYMKKINFKILNLVNAFLRILTYGKFQIFNRYQTEEQERILYRDFRADLNSATKKLLHNKILTEEQKIKLDKLPLKGIEFSYRYYIITISKLVKNENN